MGRPAKGVSDPRQERLRILTHRAKEEMLSGKDWENTKTYLQSYCAATWGVTYKTINDYVNVVNQRLGKDKELLKLFE